MLKNGTHYLKICLLLRSPVSSRTGSAGLPFLGRLQQNPFTCCCASRYIRTRKPLLVSDKYVRVSSHYNKETNPSTTKPRQSFISPYLKLMRIDKPIGSWLLFWPGGWSIALAADPSIVPLSSLLQVSGLFLAGAFVMRGAGCTINDMWDKDIDAKVSRTQDRPLVSGAINKKQALAFLAAQLSVGLAILLQLNWYSIFLGASSMILVTLYPLAKRVTHYPQLVLGLTFNWGALLGWTALHGDFNPYICLPLYAAGVSWTLLYDTIYAHQDKRDDAIIGVKSTALKFGDSTRWWLCAFEGGVLGSLAFVGVNSGMEWPYYASLAAVATHITTQIFTLDPDNPKDCAEKFVSNSTVGLLIFLAIIAGKWKTFAEYLQKSKEIDETVLTTKVDVL